MKCVQLYTRTYVADPFSKKQHGQWSSQKIHSKDDKAICYKLLIMNTLIHYMYVLMESDTIEK
jgi:hypothetical protein